MAHDSNIRNFYANTNILITGGAGFLGKMLLQKLLRTYDDIGCIYLIIRSKKGMLPQDRMRQVYENPVFDLLRKQKPTFEKKICVLDGDASLLKFGLCEVDRCVLVEKIDIVFHCAAYLNMTMELKQPVVTNVRGVCELLDLCKEMKNLKSFVMVSTAYSNTTQKVIQEKFYTSGVGFETLISLVDEIDQSTLEKITPGLIGDHPNAYAFSKNVAEQALLIKGQNMPISLFRPSIVTPAYSEPLQGWTDNIYGPIGISLAYQLGLSRAFWLDTNKKNDFVPVDYCTNALICSAWDAVNKRLRTPDDIPVYNYSAGGKYSRNWSDIVEINDRVNKVNLNRTMWKKITISTTSKYKFYILHYLLNVLPGLLIDVGLFATGRKPSMTKIYKKFLKSSKILSFFATNEWHIINNNVYAMWGKLSEEEKILHPFDMASIDYEENIRGMGLAVKLYILKEKIEDGGAANRRYQRLVFAHYTLVSILYLFLIWITCKVIMSLF